MEESTGVTDPGEDLATHRTETERATGGGVGASSSGAGGRSKSKSTTAELRSAMATQVAVKKLTAIEQTLRDLLLIKEEVDFQTDPVHYNEPCWSII